MGPRCRFNKGFMHFNSSFSTSQILWTLTFAAQLVLLVVLLGRERIRRFPWFTASIVVTTLHSLTAELLSGRIATLPLNSILITLFDLEAIVAVLVAVELARRAFGKARRLYWHFGVLALVSVAVAVVAWWGQWPSWERLTSDRSVAVLLIMRLASLKISLLANVLTVELSLLVVWLGRRFYAGWRSHTQQILVGLSTASITQLVIGGVFQAVAAPHTREEYNQLMAFQDKVLNANNAVYVAVLIWWIACLWINEPAEGVEAFAAAAPEALQVTVPVDTEPALEMAEAQQIHQPEAVELVKEETRVEAAAPAEAEKIEEVPAEMTASPSKPRKARKSPSVKAPAKPKQAKKTTAKTASTPVKTETGTANAAPAPAKVKKPKTVSKKFPLMKPELGKPADN
jgi:hypothetical protein